MDERRLASAIGTHQADDPSPVGSMGRSCDVVLGVGPEDVGEKAGATASGIEAAMRDLSDDLLDRWQPAGA